MINITKTEVKITHTALIGLDDEEMRVIRMGLDFVVSKRKDLGLNTVRTAEALLTQMRERE